MNDSLHNYILIRIIFIQKLKCFIFEYRSSVQNVFCIYFQNFDFYYMILCPIELLSTIEVLRVLSISLSTIFLMNLKREEFNTR